jgi:hypothetical protein
MGGDSPVGDDFGEFVIAFQPFQNVCFKLERISRRIAGFQLHGADLVAISVLGNPYIAKATFGNRSLQAVETDNCADLHEDKVVKFIQTFIKL